MYNIRDALRLMLLSARVMRNDAGDSRGFGFVSYQMPDQGRFHVKKTTIG